MDKTRQLSKKGQMQTLQSLGFGIVVFGITVGIGAYVVHQVQVKMDDKSAIGNETIKVTGNTTDALTSMASWLGILVIAAVGGIAIYFIVSYIAGRRR